jgi:hypothetical protein
VRIPLPTALLALLAAAHSAGAAGAVWEGFELGTTQWTTAEEGGLLQGAISKDVASEGTHAFGGRVEVQQGAAEAKAGFFLLQDLDFSGVENLSFDLFNGTKAEWTAQLVIQSGPSWDWQESQVWTVRPGWNKGLGINVKTTLLGPAMTLLKTPGNVVKVSVVLKPKEATQGALYLDNLRVTGPGAANLAPKRLQGLREGLLDGFEGKAVEWKASSGAAARVEKDLEHASQGRQGLKLLALPSNPDQNAIFAIEKEADLTNVQALVLDVYNPGPPALLAFSAAYGANWDYTESPAVRLKKGWNYNVVFDFQSKVFKSAASNWKNNSPLPSFTVRRFGLTYSPGDVGRASITLDNLRFRATDTVGRDALKPPADVAGLETPWWDLASGVPVKARNDYSAAREAGLSWTYMINGEGPSLKLGFDAATTGLSADYEWLGAADLRGVRALSFDAYNPGKDPVDVGLAVQVGADSAWLESRPARLAPGWNHDLLLPLDGAVFKSASTQWAYTASLPGRGPETIRTAYLHLAPQGTGPGEVYLARPRMLRRTLVGPLAVEGMIKTAVSMEAQTYKLWDSGASEGGFEKGVSGWQGINGGGFDASVVSTEAGQFSEGAKALRVDARGSGRDKAGVVYDPAGGAAIPDLSQVTRVRMDIYNAGPPAAVGIAFTLGAANTWIESMTVPLAGGWNRDVTFDLAAPAWKYGTTGGPVVSGATKSFSEFPADQRGAGQVKKMHVLFQKARYATYWLDNIRFGSNGSHTQEGAEAQLGARLFLGPLSVRAAVRAGNSIDGNSYALPGPFEAALQGRGQRLTLSYGQALPPLDDLLGVYTGRQGVGNGYGDDAKMAATEQGAVNYQGSLAGVQLQSFGAVPWGPAPFSFGGQSILGLRSKAAAPNGSYVGGTWLHQRLGYDAVNDLMNAPVEQSSQILEVDGEAHLPWGLSLGGAMAQTQWGVTEERFLLRDSRGLPQLYHQTIDAARDALAVKFAWSIGKVQLSATYKDVGAGFDISQTDLLYDAKKLESKLVLDLGSWGQGLQFSQEYLTHDSDDKSYKSTTLQSRLENSKEAALGFLFVFANKAEDNSTFAATTTTTRTDSNAFLLIGRSRPWTDATLSLGTKQELFNVAGTGARSSSYGLEGSQRLGAAWTLSLAAGLFDLASDAAGYTPHSYTNLHARLQAALAAGLEAELYFGRAPFGPEMAWNWLVTEPTYGLRAQWAF